MLIETRDSNGDDDDDADGVWKRSFHGIRLTLFLSLRLRHRHRQLPDANKCYSNPPAYCYIFLQWIRIVELKICGVYANLAN